MSKFQTHGVNTTKMIAEIRPLVQSGENVLGV